jgi:hypothetical protein
MKKNLKDGDKIKVGCKSIGYMDLKVDDMDEWVNVLMTFQEYYLGDETAFAVHENSFLWATDDIIEEEILWDDLLEGLFLC